MESSVIDKTEWPFINDQGKESRFWLRVDEYSSEAEIETEMAYWMKQIRDYQIDGADKAALMLAIRWMMSVIEEIDL